jgi:hypothetical protein
MRTLDTHAYGVAGTRRCRRAKRTLDERPFYGAQLRVAYAPEAETEEDVRAKLLARRREVTRLLLAAARTADAPPSRPDRPLHAPHAHAHAAASATPRATDSAQPLIGPRYAYICTHTSTYTKTHTDTDTDTATYIHPRTHTLSGCRWAMRRRPHPRSSAVLCAPSWTSSLRVKATVKEEEQDLTNATHTHCQRRRQQQQQRQQRYARTNGRTRAQWRCRG